MPDIVNCHYVDILPMLSTRNESPLPHPTELDTFLSQKPTNTLSKQVSSDAYRQENNPSQLSYQKTKIFHQSNADNQSGRVLPNLPQLIPKKASTHKSISIDPTNQLNAS